MLVLVFEISFWCRRDTGTSFEPIYAKLAFSGEARAISTLSRRRTHKLNSSVGPSNKPSGSVVKDSTPRFLAGIQRPKNRRVDGRGVRLQRDLYSIRRSPTDHHWPKVSARSTNASIQRYLPGRTRLCTISRANNSACNQLKDNEWPSGARPRNLENISPWALRDDTNDNFYNARAGNYDTKGEHVRTLAVEST